MSDINEIDLISDKIKEQLGIIKNKLNKIKDELYVDPTDAENYEKKIDLQNNLEDIEKVQSTYLNALEAKQNEKSKETRLLEYFELLFKKEPFLLSHFPYYFQTKKKTKSLISLCFNFTILGF